MSTELTPPASPAVTRRPGWPEIAAAAVGYGLSYAFLPPVAVALTEGDPVVRGLSLAAVSGIVGVIGFLVAYLVRIRDLAAFGVRRISPRWVLIAVGMGLAAFVLTRIGAFLISAFAPNLGADPQGDYQNAATGGALAFALQLLFIAVLTPIGEEFTFRAVLTNALQRYGAVVSVVVSTVVFALVHGINLALLPAVVVGAIAGVLFVRSGSVWPGVIVHAINNGLGTILTLLVAGLAV